VWLNIFFQRFIKPSLKVKKINPTDELPFPMETKFICNMIRVTVSLGSQKE